MITLNRAPSRSRWCRVPRPASRCALISNERLGDRTRAIDHYRKAASRTASIP